MEMNNHGDGWPGIYTKNFTGDGTDDIYGAFTPSSNSTVNFSKSASDPVQRVVYSWIPLRTEPCSAPVRGHGIGNGSGMATFTIDFVITGGTGIFAEVTGG